MRALVLVTVGNATQSFRRLLDAVDAAAGTGLFGEETVLIQTGNTPNFRASHCQQEAFIEMRRFETLVRDATLIISHGGAGTLINVLQAGKVAVVMPRQRQYAEHVDDHQVELVQALAKEGRVVPVLEPSDLADGIRAARGMSEKPHSNGSPQLVTLVAKAIKELGGRTKG